MAEPLDQLKKALADRYRIEREVGQGGMATVYLAEDVKHHRKVAVKVLRPQLAATLGPTRFLREIEIAAQLQHPHILPLLDSGETESFLYYVMPFVEGESLRDRITRKGELPVADAVRLLRDVADALSYAHARGVVHRDIKPDNVLLSGRHALVTDFGVAKAVSEATGRNQLTTAGVALGTPAYMAPEQAAADPNVDHRADIYAVGAMGYELLTGRPPFVGATPQQVLAMHVTTAPQPVTDHRASCPPLLAESIMRCLAKRPADRWQSADELLEQLESVSTPSGGTTPTQTQPTGAVRFEDPWYGHPLKVAGVFLLISVAVLGAVYFLTVQLGLPDWVPWGALILLAIGLPIMVITGLIERRRAESRLTGTWSASRETGMRRLVTWKGARRGGYLAFAGLALLAVTYTAMRLMGIGPVGTLVASGKLSAQDRLIVADFANHGPDSTLGRSVTEAFRIDIAQTPAVRVFGSSQVEDGLSRMNRDLRLPLTETVARELAVREGAKAVIVGDISPIGKGLVLSARLVSAVDGSELVAARETAQNETEVLGAIDRLSKRIRERIGESLRTIRASEPLEEVTTSSLEALRLYTEGAAASDRSDNDRAISLLRQAIALDSGFAMAWRKLAVALSNSSNSNAEAVTAATRAYQHRDRLTEIERYQTTAYYYFNVDWDPEKTIAAYRAILELRPDDQIAPNNLALILIMRRRYSDAEPIAQQAVDRGQSGTMFAQLIVSQMGQGKMKEARATIDQFFKREPTSSFPRRLLSAYFTSNQMYDSARAQLRILAQSQEQTDQSAVPRLGAAVALSQGQVAEAERQVREYMAANERRGLPQNYLVGAANLARIAVEYRKDPATGQRILEDALARYPLNKLDPLDRPYPQMASIRALLGEPAKGLALMKEYESLVPAGLRVQDALDLTDDFAASNRARGLLALAEKNPRTAIIAFRQWWNEAACPSCALSELAQAFDAAAQTDSALIAYERALNAPRGLGSGVTQSWTLARDHRRLGELYETQGEKQKALDHYTRFVELWRDADPILQPEVKDVKERMARLAGETQNKP